MYGIILLGAITDSPSGILYAAYSLLESGKSSFLSPYDFITELCTPRRLVSFQIHSNTFDCIIGHNKDAT